MVRRAVDAARDLSKRVTSPPKLGERPGEGAARGRSAMTAEAPSKFSPLREERGGRGRGWGTADAARCLPKHHRSSPLSARNERGGAGGGAPRGRSSKTFEA